MSLRRTDLRLLDWFIWRIYLFGGLYTFVNIGHFIILSTNCRACWGIQIISEAIRGVDLGDLNFFRVTEIKIITLNNSRSFRSIVFVLNVNISKKDAYIVTKIKSKMQVRKCKLLFEKMKNPILKISLPVTTTIVMPGFPWDCIVIQDILSIVKT